MKHLLNGMILQVFTLLLEIGIAWTTYRMHLLPNSFSCSPVIVESDGWSFHAISNCYLITTRNKPKMNPPLYGQNEAQLQSNYTSTSRASHCEFGVSPCSLGTFESNMDCHVKQCFNQDQMNNTLQRPIHPPIDKFPFVFPPKETYLDSVVLSTI